MEATKVTGKDRTIQLLECCDDQLRKGVTRSIGLGRTLTDRPEEEILTLVRRLAVREENTMVARVALHNMRQDRDETVRSFSARIRGQAGVCKFFLPCPDCSQTVHYTEEVRTRRRDKRSRRSGNTARPTRRQKSGHDV